MEKEVNEGIILKTTDYKESSKILHIFTKEGKKSVLAKGVKKINNKYRYLAYPLSKISFLCTNNKLPTFIDGDLLVGYNFLKDDLTANLYANHLLELAYYALDSDINTIKLYDFLLKCLNFMNDDKDCEQISFIFELKLLHLLGVSPNFKSCIKCNKEELYSFSFPDGAILCKNHALEKYQNLDKINHLYYIDLSNDSLLNLSVEERKNIRKFIDEFYKHHVGITTKSHLFF